MSYDEHAEAADRTTDPRRRTLLRALGAAGALAATGGVASGRTRAPIRALDEHGDDGGSGQNGIDPMFGFAAPSEDVEPPVEPDHTVQLLIRGREGAPIPEFFFEPTGLHIEPGDTVKFAFATPHHNVTAYHSAFGQAMRVPEDVPPFSAPVLPAGAYWLYTFEEPGVYEVNCAPHEVFGMAMRIVVGSTEGYEPLPDLCAGEGAVEGGDDGLRLPALTAYTVLTDPALDPERIVDAGAVSWDDLDPASKQLFVQIVGFPPCPEDC